MSDQQKVKWLVLQIGYEGWNLRKMKENKMENNTGQHAAEQMITTGDKSDP